MFDRWTGLKLHDYLQALGLFILAFGVPMNKVLMSIGTIWLAANLLLKADFQSYWTNWRKSFVFWTISGLLLLHLLGLLYTENYGYALSDLNAKLPLFVIPIALIAYPIEKKYFNFILIGFLLSLVITSGINFNYMRQHDSVDYRDFSLFGSHIRYALIVVGGILVSLHLFFQFKKWRILFLLLMVWFTYYTFISQVLSGFIVFSFLILGLIIHFIATRKNSIIKYASTFVFLSAFLAVGIFAIYLFNQKELKIDFEKLPLTTKYGEKYYHDAESVWFENGHHIRSFIAEKELKESWNERSTVDYKTKFSDGYTIREILIRYMTSKGLTKDREGMESMTEEDITNVENQVFSVIKTYPLIQRKTALLRNDIYQFKVSGNPNGNSFLQRVEHWKAAKGIIAKNWIFGVGTGDVQQAFNQEYELLNTRLDKENWNRAHNQFMTFWISFGIIGFLLFTGFWFVFLQWNIQLGNLFGVGFTMIAIASFLSEDTIETQQGVTFIALFIGLVCLLNRWIVSPKEN